MSCLRHILDHSSTDKKRFQTGNMFFSKIHHSQPRIRTHLMCSEKETIATYITHIHRKMRDRLRSINNKKDIFPQQRTYFFHIIHRSGNIGNMTTGKNLHRRIEHSGKSSPVDSVCHWVNRNICNSKPK